GSTRLQHVEHHRGKQKKRPHPCKTGRREPGILTAGLSARCHHGEFDPGLPILTYGIQDHLAWAHIHSRHFAPEGVIIPDEIAYRGRIEPGEHCAFSKSLPSFSRVPEQEA